MRGRSNFLLEEAIQLHRQGSVGEAARRYRDVLRSDAKNVDALYFLGMAEGQQGRFAEAVAALRKAVKLAPKHAAAHYLLGRSHQELGEVDQALKCYARAADAQRDHVEAYLGQAQLLTALGRLGDALATCDRLLAVRPDCAEGWSNRGVVLHMLQRDAEAVEACKRAVALKPDLAEAHANLGNALAGLERHEEAVASFDRTLAANPDFAEVLVTRGNSLRRLQRNDEALASYDAAIKARPSLAEAHLSRGFVLDDQGRFASAVESFDRALALTDDPRLQAQAYAFRAGAYDTLDRYDEAFADAERALRLAPDDNEVHLRVGMIELLHGRWQEGLPRWERRIALGRGLPSKFVAPCPLWNGEVLGNDLLLLRGEQGLGDRIQFSCYVPLLAARGFRIALWTEPVLVPLLKGVPGLEAVVSDLSEIARTPGMRWLPIASLPFVLGTTPDSVPQTAPWISVPPDRVAAWKRRLGEHGFKIAIAWQGNPRLPSDETRSIPLREFAPLADIPGVRLISLQKRPGAEHIGQVPFGARIETPLDETDLSPDALLDTAAVMSAADLIVTSDSMLAHLSGALNRPAFVALRWYPDWRWLLEREDCPWYPSMRLFRQSCEGDWPDVFTRIAGAVHASMPQSTR